MSIHLLHYAWMPQLYSSILHVKVHPQVNALGMPLQGPVMGCSSTHTSMKLHLVIFSTMCTHNKHRPLHMYAPTEMVSLRLVYSHVFLLAGAQAHGAGSEGGDRAATPDLHNRLDSR